MMIEDRRKRGEWVAPDGQVFPLVELSGLDLVKLSTIEDDTERAIAMTRRALRRPGTDERPNEDDLDRLFERLRQDEFTSLVRAAVDLHGTPPDPN